MRGFVSSGNVLFLCIIKIRIYDGDDGHPGNKGKKKQVVRN